MLELGVSSELAKVRSHVNAVVVPVLNANHGQVGLVADDDFDVFRKLSLSAVIDHHDTGRMSLRLNDDVQGAGRVIFAENRELNLTVGG